MNQEITISTSIVNYFTQNLPVYGVENNAQKIIKLLGENYFTDDERRDLYNKLWAETKQITIEGTKIFIRDLLEHWFTQCVSVKKLSSFSVEKLTQKSKDRILLSPFCNDKEKMRDRFNFNIETHDEESFVNPKVSHRLKHNDSVLRLNKNDEYDIKILLEPYLRNAKKIIIKDPFLPNYKAFNNLKKIVNFNNSSNLELWTHSRKNYCEGEDWKQKNYSRFEEYVELKKNKLKLLLEFYPIRKHYDRYIITEKTKITLPGGLDFLDKDGKINSTEDSIEVIIQSK